MLELYLEVEGVFECLVEFYDFIFPLMVIFYCTNKYTIIGIIGIIGIT